MNNKKIESNYYQGKLHGTYKTYNLFGLTKECYYVMDTLHGDYKEYTFDWHDKSHLYISCHYSNGLLEGEYIHNFQYSSAPWIKGCYKNGKRNGTFTKYFDKTDYRVTSQEGIECQSYYVDGKLSGLHREWNKEGNLVREIHV